MVSSSSITFVICGYQNFDTGRSSECLAINSLGRFKNTSSNPVMVDSDGEIDSVCKDPAKDSKVGKPKTSVVDTWFSIKNRCSPTQLTKVVKSLTSRQKEIIECLGFGKLLSLQLDGIPQNLGHFVVQNFNEVKMEICLENEVVKIDVEESPESVVTLSDSSPKMKAAVVGIRKSDIKR
ncbi:hypothetical protein R6Q57_021093 [Mikania cordata]